MSNKNKGLIEFVIREIEKRTGGLKCPLCGNTNKDHFHIDQQLYHLLSFEEKTVNQETGEMSLLPQSPLRVIRTIAVSCKKCGHVMLFNIQAIQKEEENV